MTPTLRRLNDLEKFYGLNWPLWAGLLSGFSVLYAAFRLSPLPPKVTIVITLTLISTAATIWMGVSGQALSPTRQIAAIWHYYTRPKRYVLPDRPDRQGLVLNAAPVGSELAPDEHPTIGFDVDALAKEQPA